MSLSNGFCSFAEAQEACQGIIYDSFAGAQEACQGMSLSCHQFSFAEAQEACHAINVPSPLARNLAASDPNPNPNGRRPCRRHAAPVKKALSKRCRSDSVSDMSAAERTKITALNYVGSRKNKNNSPELCRRQKEQK
jgi:hypothetical protein